MFPFNLRVFTVCMAAAILSRGPLAADEGMWLFNDPPRAELQQRYGFNPTPAWLNHLQKSSVRFNNGGSGSFVSPDGLVMTNHHVAADTIQKVSTPEHNYMETGFYARTPAEELRAPDLELNVLEDIVDVTARVNAAVKPGMTPAQAHDARRAVMNTMEQESLQKTGLRSDVVTLYNGGRYNLYRYKKYTDVRLVFAPEKAAAFFGGDADNFEYPRYDLDISFFRVYENGKPARITDYLKWSPDGARDGELVFVSGNPGRTDRLDTMRHLEFLRDRVNPFLLNVLRRREITLLNYGERSVENARQAEDELFGYQNSRKARLGMLAGLQDPAIMAQKQAEQDRLRRAVTANPELQRKYGDAWTTVDQSIAAWDRIYMRHYLLENGGAFNSTLFDIARDLVRLAQEKPKPNAERLREYSEAALPSLEQEMFSPAPVYPRLEIAKLADSLSMMQEQMGAADPLVRRIMAGKSPRERAVQLVEGTKLAGVAARKALAAQSLSQLRASPDPMIQLAFLVDPAARSLRRTYEEQVVEPQRQAYAKIANARFALYGSSQYPDATFTLRLSFGQTRGYTEEGRRIPWATTLGGAYEHAAAHGSVPPFALPRSWMDARARLNLNTPFNFVSTADIIGGNSGSPVVNREGSLVGIIFDGNIESLVLDYIYTEKQARAVAVHSAAIVEALRQIYGANRLVAELTGAAAPVSN